MSVSPAASTQKPQFAWPGILTQGFRPFFLASTLWSASALVIWLYMLTGEDLVPTAFSPLSWHTHEMLYGFVTATIAGFLLTAIPNWTGRLPLQGMPLLALVSLWIFGRIAVATSSWMGEAIAAAIDLSFLAALAGVVLREIVAGRNWRNLPMSAAILTLFTGNAWMHAEAAGWISDTGTGWRIGIAVIVMLISLVGGRIIPSFTRNWLMKHRPERLPASFGTPDKLALAGTGLAMILWVVWPESIVTALALLIAATAQGIRVLRWQGHRTLSEPLLWILHLAYAWLPIGLALLGASLVWVSVPPNMAIHALTAGAIGTITLGVMTRVVLGHTGRALQADGMTVLLYLAITLAALTRLCAALLPEHTLLLTASGIFWVAAYAGFVLKYGRYLLQPRPGR